MSLLPLWCRNSSIKSVEKDIERRFDCSYTKTIAAAAAAAAADDDDDDDDDDAERAVVTVW